MLMLFRTTIGKASTRPSWYFIASPSYFQTSVQTPPLASSRGRFSRQVYVLHATAYRPLQSQTEPLHGEYTDQETSLGVHKTDCQNSIVHRGQNIEETIQPSKSINESEISNIDLQLATAVSITVKSLAECTILQAIFEFHSLEISEMKNSFEKIRSFFDVGGERFNYTTTCYYP